MPEEINTTYFATSILPDFCKDRASLCKKLNEPYVRGNELKARIKVWDRHLLMAKSGKRGIIVYGVRESPLPKTDKRYDKPAKYSPFTESLLANKIARALRDGKIVDDKIEIKFSECYYELGFCNSRFMKKDFSDIDTRLEDYYVTKKDCSWFVGHEKEVLRFNHHVKQALKKLNNYEGIRSETSLWTSKKIKSGSMHSFIDENPATEQEIAIYESCKKNALEMCGFANMNEAFIKYKAKTVYKLASDLFKEETGKSIHPKSFVYIARELLRDGRYLLDEETISRYKYTVNNLILEKIYGGKENRESYIFEKKKKCTYKSNNKHGFKICVCEICIPADVLQADLDADRKAELALAEYLLNIDERHLDRLIAVEQLPEAA